MKWSRGVQPNYNSIGDTTRKRAEFQESVSNSEPQVKDFFTSQGTQGSEYNLDAYND